MGGAFKEYLKLRLDDLGEEGVRIIKQMLGAALIPYVPRIFFIEGVTNAGKSTLALLIKRLLGEENVESVQPVVTGMGGDRFNWTPTIGKLANIVLELDEKKPLDTTVLKMVRDKTSVSMDRKGRDHVKATLPFFHIYCCNQMPPSLEGNSGALNNRVTMLYFKPGYMNGKSGIVEYAQHIWMDDAGGVLEAAREGLEDLIESKFKYFESSASKEAVKEWQKTNDSIALFFEDLETKEWSLASLEGKEWEKGSQIYESFCEWAQKSGKRPMGKHAFYKLLRVKHGVPCQQRGEGGVLFKVSGIWKRECEVSASQKSPMITDTLAY
jgi:phage/plasmid-associated DNA primase